MQKYITTMSNIVLNYRATPSQTQYPISSTISKNNILYFLERSQYIYTMSRLLFIVLTLVYNKFRIC